MPSTTKLTVPLKHIDALVKCPYCDTESSIRTWNIDIELGSSINGNRLEIEYFILDVECPVCGDYIDVRNVERIPIDNIIRLKEVIESYNVDVDEKKAKCPFCGKWNDFYDWDFKGIVSNLNIEVSNRAEILVDYNKAQEIFITTATCTECNHELQIDNIKVHVPITDEDIIRLVDKLCEISSNY